MYSIPQRIILLHLLLFQLLNISACRDGDKAGRQDPLILISVDGLMPSYTESNPTPHLDSLAEKGLLASRMNTVFPSLTFPAHYSIATGLYVENHGIIANVFTDPELDSEFRYGPPPEENDERWWGGEPVWITAERQDLTSATMFWPGSEASFEGDRPGRFVWYDSSLPNRQRIDSVLSWVDPNGEVQADFSTLYFSHVDKAGHEYGPNSSEVDQAVMNTDSLIGALIRGLQKKGLSNSVNLMITSDHGMAASREDKVIFLEDLIDIDHVEMVAWNPVAMMRPHKGMKDSVYSALKAAEAEQDGFSVYLREEVPERFGFRDHPRIPEIVVIADVPWSLTTRRYFYGRGLPAGQHGYDPREEAMAAYFLATGPAFPSGKNVDTVEAVDLYEVMCYILDIDPADNDGRIDRRLLAE